MAQTFYSKNLSMLKEYSHFMTDTNDWDNNKYRTVYIGSYLSLDPCGRYHHILSPNGCTNRCVAFWDSLDNAADRLGGWIESGEGDPLDIYFCVSV